MFAVSFYSMLLILTVACVVMFYRGINKKVSLSNTPKEHQMRGRLIVIDGASSSGKTSMIEHLMNELDSSYQCIAVDTFVSPIFIEQQKVNLPEKEFFERVDLQIDAMIESVKNLVLSGKNIILDTVLCGLKGEEHVKKQLTPLQELHPTIILVHCPLLKLVERVKLRNKKALQENRPQDQRSIGTVLYQFGNIYKLQKDHMKKLIDKASFNDIERACELAKYEWDTNILLFQQFKEWLRFQLGIDDEKVVELTTRLEYDFIIDTSKNTSRECAQLFLQKYFNQ